MVDGFRVDDGLLMVDEGVLIVNNFKLISDD